MTAAKTYQVGTSKFRDKATAEQAAANRATLAAAVNREGMTADERADAFVAFFSKAKN